MRRGFKSPSFGTVIHPHAGVTASILSYDTSLSGSQSQSVHLSIITAFVIVTSCYHDGIVIPQTTNNTSLRIPPDSRTVEQPEMESSCLPIATIDAYRYQGPLCFRNIASAYDTTCGISLQQTLQSNLFLLQLVVVLCYQIKSLVGHIMYSKIIVHSLSLFPNLIKPMVK